jgi:hypothetical protein
MRKYVFILCFAIGSIFASYPPFTVPHEDIVAVLNGGINADTTTRIPLPADISFACADIKYKDGSLKFCECGDGIYMSLRTAQVTLNNHVQRAVAPYWGIFWHYLAQFNMPIWLVGDGSQENALAIRTLKILGGQYVKNLSQLRRNQLFDTLCTKNFAQHSAIQHYHGIIVFRSGSERGRDGKAIKDFKRKHPEFIYVNNIARPYIIRKDNTNNLFFDAHLNHLIPEFNTYSSTYSPELTRQIFNDFDAQWLIIKPVFSSLAFGVNLIDKNNIDDFLKLILSNKNEISRNTPRGLSYWRRNSPSHFFVSAYAPSKTIYKDNLPYDPTMRIVFMMSHNNGTLNITVIAGFWKIPLQSLAGKEGSLTDKHVTIAHSGAYYTGILIDPKDWRNIKEILDTNLPMLYQTMLEKHALETEIKKCLT